jgi:zinc/manganese transport system substrate-binding protein
MGIKIFSSLIALLATLLSGPGAAALRVFACEPEWGALVAELAGDRADVSVATTAYQDVHHIQARPSLIAKVRRADLLICTGAGLEAGWLPILLRRGGNPRVLPGRDGYLEAADHVPMLEVPERLDRAQGDIHPRGNPHIHLDPRNITRVAQALSERLIRVDPQRAAHYRQRTGDFLRRWEAALRRWQERASPLKGMAVVVHHSSWVYLNHWLGLRQIATLEPKPGIPPTSRHLSAVLHQLQETPARAVLRAPYQDSRPSEWLYERTGIAMLEMPYTVGGNSDAGDLFGLFDSTLSRLLTVAP